MLFMIKGLGGYAHQAPCENYAYEHRYVTAISRSVSLSVGHNRELTKNSRTDRDANFGKHLPAHWKP